jgi:hypothetical protein
MSLLLNKETCLCNSKVGGSVAYYTAFKHFQSTFVFFVERRYGNIQREFVSVTGKVTSDYIG